MPGGVAATPFSRRQQPAQRAPAFPRYAGVHRFVQRPGSAAARSQVSRLGSPTRPTMVSSESFDIQAAYYDLRNQDADSVITVLLQSSPTFGPALRNRLTVQATPYTKVTAL